MFIGRGFQGNVRATPPATSSIPVPAPLTEIDGLSLVYRISVTYKSFKSLTAITPPQSKSLT